MNILLFGSKGFIGSRLKDTLAREGHVVWESLRGPIKDIRWGSICHADLVINAAGNTENEAVMEQDNTDLAIEVARCCHAFEKRLIHIGSMMELWPSSAYAQSKLKATEAILAMDGDFCVIRPATVYGPGDKDTAFLPTLWRSFVEDRPFICRDDIRPWIHVDDLAEIVADATRMVGLQGSILNVGAADHVSNADLVAVVEAAIGRKLDVTHVEGKTYLMSTESWSCRPTLTGVREWIGSRLYPVAWTGAEL